MYIESFWQHLHPESDGIQKGELHLLLSGAGHSRFSDFKRFEDGLLILKNERFKTLDNYLERYLVTVQKWDVEKIKLYLKNAKNVRVKGAEFLQKVNRQDSELEHWYYGQECIMVTNKYTLEIVEVGDWIK